MRDASERVAESIQQVSADGLANFDTEAEHEFVFQTGVDRTEPATDSDQ